MFIISVAISQPSQAGGFLCRAVFFCIAPDPGSSEKIGHQIRRHAVPHVAKHTVETSGVVKSAKRSGPQKSSTVSRPSVSSEEHFVRALACVRDKHVCVTHPALTGEAVMHEALSERRESTEHHG